MKKLTRVLVFALIAAMLISCVAYAEGAEEVVLPEGSTKENTLIVGSPAMNGDFINGFGSSAYFRRVLRRFTDCTPRQIRRGMNGAI